MKSIWKFPLKMEDCVTIDMPIGAEILTVQTQFDTPCIWCLVDTEARKHKRTFEIFGTGHPLEDTKQFTRKYIGTFQVNSGAHVFHLFEL